MELVETSTDGFLHIRLGEQPKSVDRWKDPRLDPELYRRHKKLCPALCLACKAPTTLKCSACHAVAVCSKECFRFVWKEHKADCANICNATAQINEAQVKFFHQKSVPVSLSLDVLKEFNDKLDAVFAKYGVSGMIDSECQMPPVKIAAFFADLLQLHDSGSDENKGLPLPTRLFLNRRYNNAYAHLINIFPSLVDRVHALCRARKIGNTFRGQK